MIARMNSISNCQWKDRVKRSLTVHVLNRIQIHLNMNIIRQMIEKKLFFGISFFGIPRISEQFYNLSRVY